MNSFSNTLNRFKKWNFASVRGAFAPQTPLHGCVIAFKLAGRPPTEKNPGDATGLHLHSTLLGCLRSFGARKRKLLRASLSYLDPFQRDLSPFSCQIGIYSMRNPSIPSDSMEILIGFEILIFCWFLWNFWKFIRGPEGGGTPHHPPTRPPIRILTLQAWLWCSLIPFPSAKIAWGGNCITRVYTFNDHSPRDPHELKLIWICSGAARISVRGGGTF